MGTTHVDELDDGLLYALFKVTRALSATGFAAIFDFIQLFAHFFRHAKGRPQVMHVFSGVRLFCACSLPYLEIIIRSTADQSHWWVEGEQ